jgi:hypothetical protein
MVYAYGAQYIRIFVKQEPSDVLMHIVDLYIHEINCITKWELKSLAEWHVEDKLF